MQLIDKVQHEYSRLHEDSKHKYYYDFDDFDTAQFPIIIRSAVRHTNIVIHSIIEAHKGVDLVYYEISQPKDIAFPALKEWSFQFKPVLIFINDYGDFEIMEDKVKT